MCIYSNEARVLCYWGFTPHITALSAGREQFWKSCWLSRQTAASAKASWWYTAPTLMKTCIRNWVFLAGVHSCLCGKWKKCRSCWKLWHPAQKVKQAQEVHFIYYKPYLYFFLQFYCNTTANKHVHPPDTLWKPIAARKLLKKITDVKERGFNFSPTVFLLGSPSPSEVVALLTSCLDRPWPVTSSSPSGPQTDLCQETCRKTSNSPTNGAISVHLPTWMHRNMKATAHRH